MAILSDINGILQINDDGTINIVGGVLQVDGTQVLNSTLDASFTSLTVDTTTLVVDDVNNRVGIGTASPSVTLDVAGDVRLGNPTGATEVEIADVSGANYRISTGGYDLTFAKYSASGASWNPGLRINGTDANDSAPNVEILHNLTVQGSTTIEGNLTVNGTTTTISASNLAVEDNMIYLNDGSSSTNVDLGWAGNYNDGTYAHAGLFRDATDGIFKFYDSYTPEPGVEINTGHASFNYADIHTGDAQVSALSAASATITGNMTVDSTTLVVDSVNNRVGIGTGTPGYLLHVNGAMYSGTHGIEANSLIQRRASTWGANSPQDVLYNGWTTNTGDYTYVKAAGNSTGPHGQLIVGDSRVYFGETTNETGGIVDSATAPFDTNTWGWVGNGDAYLKGSTGIGTSSSGYKLDVYHTTTPVARFTGSTNAYVDFTDGTVNTRLQNSGASYYGTTTNHSLFLKTNGTNKVSILTSGKVGIGTDSPDSALQINNTSGSTILELRRTDTNTTGSIGTINFTALDGHSVSSIGAVGDGDDEGAHIVFKTTSAAASNSPFNAATPEVMRITSAGDVGVGTTGPNAKLEVADSDGGATVFINNTQAWTAANLSEFNNTALVINPRSSGAQLRFSGAAGDVRIQSLTSDLTTAEDISLNPFGGNIGIGITNPSYTLDVNGDIRQTGDNTRWTGTYTYLRSDNPFSFLAHSSGNAQTAKFKSIQVATTYSGTPPDNGILFGADTTLYRYDANVLATGTSDSFIVPDGNVGVGTNNPTVPLHIYSPADGKLTLQVSSGDGSEWNYINFVGSDGTRDGYVGTDNTGNLQVYSDLNGNYLASASTHWFTNEGFSVGTSNWINGLQVGANTFNGTNGVYANNRVGISNHGALTSIMYASTYNGNLYPDYGLVFVHGPSTSSYNVWSISPDGPAKGDSLNFIYGANATNIHTVTPKVVFDGNGHVGIGSASPTVQLEVYDSTTWDTAHFSSNTATGAGISLDATNTGVRWSLIAQGTSGGANDNNLGFHLTSAGTSGQSTGYKFVMTADGKLGIGQMSPSAPLHIEHTNLSGEPYSGIRVTNSSTSGNYYTGVAVDAVGQAHYRYMLNGSLKFQTRVGYGNGTDIFQIYSWTQGTDILSIPGSTGYVGIGTTGPSKQLHLYNSVNSQDIQFRLQNPNTGSSAFVEFDIHSDSHFMRFGTTSAAYTGWTGDSFIYASENLRLGAGNDEKVWIGSDGRVGIGTTTFPISNTKLAVDGNTDLTNSDSSRAFRFYQGATLRGGLGTGSWTGGNSSSGVGLYATGGDITFHHNSGTPTVRISDEGHFGLERSDATSGVTAYYPKIVYPNVNWSANGTSTGKVQIATPGNLNNYDMVHIELTVYEYNSMNASTIIIGGHNWTSGGASGSTNAGWHNYGVKVIGTFNKPIYLTQDGSKRYIVLGDNASSWTYGMVSVARVHGSTFYSTSIDWVSDWSISQVTSSSYTWTSSNLNTVTSTTLSTPGEFNFATLNGNGFKIGRNNDNNMYINVAATGAAGVLLTDSAGSFRSQWYGDGTNYGFLDGAWGGWDIKKVTNGAMYFNGDNTYYLQPESTSAMSKLAINETGGTYTNALTIGNDNAEDFIKFRTNTQGQGQQTAGTGISWTWNSNTVYGDEWAAVRAIFPGNGDTHMTFSTKPTGGGSMAERIRITNSGYVGIGTNSPYTKLDVNGGIKVTSGAGANYGPVFSANGTRAQATVGHTTTTKEGIFWHSDDDYSIAHTVGAWTSPTYQQLEINWPTGIVLDTEAQGTYSYSYTRVNQMLSVGGNVGIGTTNPSTQLHIYETGVADGSINRQLLLDTQFAVASIDSNDRVSIGFSVTNSGGGNQTRDAIIYGYDDRLWLNTTGDASITYIGSNGSYFQDEGTTHSHLGKISSISFGRGDGSGNWDEPYYHGIRSTEYDGNWGDDISINSFHNITLRLDSNNNNNDGYVRIMNNTQTNSTIHYFGFDGTRGVTGLSGYVQIGDMAGPQHPLDLALNGSTTDTSTIRFGLYNGDAGGTTNYAGSGVIWKPKYSGYTKRSAGIISIGEGDYFRSGLAFYTGNYRDASTDWDERMRIDMDGNVGIGISEPTNKFEVHGSAGQLFAVSDSMSGTIFEVNDIAGIPSIEVLDTGQITLAEFQGSVLIGSLISNGSKLQVEGDITATGDVTAYASSDERLKENLEPITNALEKVNTLTGYTYNWNERARNKDREIREAGVIAQQVAEVLPEVTTTRDDGYMAVNYERMVPLLIEAIKELKAEIEELKRK